MDELLKPEPHAQVAATIVNDQAVIVMSDSGMMTILNEAASRIWQLCDGGHTIEQITGILVAEYKVDLEQARGDVTEFLEQMLGMQAIVLNR